MAGGLLSFLGWALHQHALTDWWGTGIAIKANAALACVGAGLALVIAVLLPSAITLLRVLGFAVSALGAVTLFEHITGIDVGIDTALFAEDGGALATAAPGRMGPPASAGFFALGLALMLVRGSRHARAWSVALSMPVLAICILSLTGYWYGAKAMYTIPRLTGIALQTATMVAALSIGIMAALPEHQPTKTFLERGDSGNLARRLIVSAIAVPLILGWLRVKGERFGLYEFAFGAALRTVVEIGILTSIIWWSIRTIRAREIERQRAEREREVSDRRSRLVLEASAVPFTVLSPVKHDNGAVIDFTWTYLNAAAATALRRSSGELVGVQLGQAFAQMCPDSSAFDALVAVTTHREIREFEAQFSLGETQRWFKVVASPLDDQVAVWSADVTETKRQEFELRAADRRKDEFLATLAHELRNPLAPIRQAAMIANKAAATEVQRKWSGDVIERQVQHMSLLLDDLIEVSRITRGKLQLRKEPALLHVIVEAGIETARPLIDGKGLSLEVELPAPPIHLNVDSLRIAQIVSNLLNNAAKYTPEGGGIGLRVEIVGESFLLRVSDSGIGIAAEHLTEIFRMFSQVKSAQEKSEGGLGIGLALTKALVELHGGTIRADSAGIDCGSTFTVSIPRAVVLIPPASL